MTTQRANFWILLMFAAITAYAAVLYPILPDRIPIHWNFRGEADGWGPKGMIFLGPSLIMVGWALLNILPKLSPKQFDIDSFRATFNLIMFIVSAMFAFLALVIIQATLNRGFDIGKWMMTGISLFLALLGNLMGKTRRNFYVGIRTPWTLASERVWDVTHRLGARWMVSGGLIAAGLALLGVNMVLTIAILLISSLYPVLFSYIYYKRLEKSGGL